jgi:hypothetical protein
MQAFPESLLGLGISANLNAFHPFRKSGLG